MEAEAEAPKPLKIASLVLDSRASRQLWMTGTVTMEAPSLARVEAKAASLAKAAQKGAPNRPSWQGSKLRCVL